MNSFDEMLLARNEIANHMNAIMGSMKMSEIQMMFVMEAVMSDLRARCIIRNSYQNANRAAEEVTRKEKMDEKTEGQH